MSTPGTGSFCWFELGTNNQPAAVAFYQKLFGWTVQDSPMGPGEVYSMFKLNGEDAAAAFTLRPEQRANANARRARSMCATPVASAAFRS